MGGRGGSSSSGYNARGNEYTNRFKDKGYASSVRKKLRDYSDADIDSAIASIKDGISFNNEKMKANMGKPNYSQHNYDLYGRNVKLESDLKEFQYEKKKRKQDLKRAEGVLSAMRDAGLKPVKSVSETAEILRKRWD